MSTIGYVDPRVARREISRTRACAVAARHCTNTHRITDMDELYDVAAEGPSTIVTDVPMADPRYLGLSEGRDRVLVHYSGQDTGRSAWARRLLPRDEELATDPDQRLIRDRYERIIREANFELMQRPMVNVTAYFGKNHDFMGRISYTVDRKYAKLAMDLVTNFIRVTPETEALYRDSKPLGNVRDVRIVCHPEWVNPDWLARKARINPEDPRQTADDPEPPRILMLFDVDHNTAYLLGGRYFGETKKAALTLIWNSAVEHGYGMPIHGSSKTLHVRRRDAERPAPVTFITIGLSGSGKSTLGNASHRAHLDYDAGEHVRVGNDDALVVLYEPEDPRKGTVGLEDGCYNKSDDYKVDSDFLRTVQTAENVMVTRFDDQLILIHEDVLCANGRVETARHLLPGADDCLDTPWPDYLCLLMKDETLPPVTLIDDPRLTTAMYMTLATKSSTAENIPLQEMNRLKMVPGANPFAVWEMNTEAHALEKMLTVTGARGLVLNTGGFYKDPASNDRGVYEDIPKELSLAIYPRLAKGQIRWEDWELFPGCKLPAPGSFDDIDPRFQEKYNPASLAAQEEYRKLLNDRIQQRLIFLAQLGIDAYFTNPLHRVLLTIHGDDRGFGPSQVLRAYGDAFGDY